MWPLMKDYIQANTDGRLHDARVPSISPLNRGYLYGDAVYEVWRTHGGVVFAFDRHWNRLLQSAAALHLDLPFDRKALFRQIQKTVAAFLETAPAPPALYIRLQLTRGGGAMGMEPALADAPSWTLLVRGLSEPADGELERGMHLEIADTLRRNHPQTLNPAWKTGNYLNNLLCLREAKARGGDEVIMLNLAGALTEASTRNLFFISGRDLYTPSLSDGILEGITRGLLMEMLAGDGDFTVHEETLYPERLPEFSACFMTSTTQDLVPVRRIGKIEFQHGPDSVVLALRSRFRGWARAEAERHPEWRLG